MQRNSVQCFGYRIDNLKCVPICTRRSLQMSVSFLFTWQIAETLKKLLLLFSCILCNFLSFFFFFCILFLLLKSYVYIISFSKHTCALPWEDTASSTGCCLGRVGLIILSSFFSVDCLTVMSYFYRWITILQNLSEQGMYYSHSGWEKATWDCSPELPGKCAAERVFHLSAPAGLSTWTFLLPKC